MVLSSYGHSSTLSQIFYIIYYLLFIIYCRNVIHLQWIQCLGSRIEEIVAKIGSN